MTAPLALSRAASTDLACQQHGAKPLETSCRKSRGAQKHSEDAELARFARLLWAAFPGAASANDLAETAAAVLSTEGRAVHPKTVRNWLAGENAPHFRYVIRVLALAGAERVFDLIDPEGAR